MLKTLYIRNFALIREHLVEFSAGLNVITGETGAGKSMLIDALNLVLGDRASSELVRTGANKAVIEAVLSGSLTEKLVPLLAGAGIEELPEPVLRREVAASGQSRCFINDTPCTAGLLKKAGELLIDLHGQHDHQLLLHTSSHEEMLDAFADTSRECGAYRQLHSRLNELYKEKNALENKARETAERREIVEFQFNELNRLDLQEGEEEALESELVLLENAETLHGLGSDLGDLLCERDHSVSVTLSSVRHVLEKLVSIDKRFENNLAEILDAESMVEDLYRFAKSYTATIEFNSERLDTLRNRQLQLQRIRKKYARSIPELIAFRDELSLTLGTGESLAEETARIGREIEEVKRQVSAAAIRLSEKRQKGAARLDETLQLELSGLGIERARFRTSFTAEPDPEGDITVKEARFKAFANGHEKIEFLFSANTGEELKPLARAASGGEISRVMLALKSVLAESAELPILVFDEIDTGISGATALAVAASLKKLSRLHQIIAITHLPQIAAMGERHLSVQKTTENGRTEIGVTSLDKKEHLKAVATLMSGASLSGSSLKLAEELIESGKSI